MLNIFIGLWSKQSDKILAWTKKFAMDMNSKKHFHSNFRLNAKLNFYLTILCSVGEISGVLLHVQNDIAFKKDAFS